MAAPCGQGVRFITFGLRGRFDQKAANCYLSFNRPTRGSSVAYELSLSHPRQISMRRAPLASLGAGQHLHLLRRSDVDHDVPVAQAVMQG